MEFPTLFETKIYLLSNYISIFIAMRRKGTEGGGVKDTEWVRIRPLPFHACHVAFFMQVKAFNALFIILFEDDLQSEP